MDTDRPPHEMTRGFGIVTGLPAPRRPDRWRGVTVGVLRWGGLLVGAGVLVGAAASAAWTGAAFVAVGRFLDFYCGVFALVALSLAVMIGVLASDGRLLAPRDRVRAQVAHRVAAFTAVVMLLLHLATQLLRHRVGWTQAFLPVGAGPLAFYLLIVAVAGGVARGWFASSRFPRMWRLLHLAAYVAWPLAIAHGLTAGRTPAPWVTASYVCCLVAVALALAARPVLRRSLPWGRTPRPPGLRPKGGYRRRTG